VANASMAQGKVYVSEGVYNQNSGEKYPLTVKNVELIGNPDDLEAVKIATQMTFKNSKVRGLHFYRSVTAKDGTVIQHNAFSGIDGKALNFRGPIHVKDNIFKGTGRSISGDIRGGTLTIANNKFLNNSYAVRTVIQEAKVAIVSNEVRAKENGAGFGIRLQGGNNQAVIQNNEISAEDGIVIYFRRGGGKALLQGNTISAGKTGLELGLLSSGGEIGLAGNKISGRNSIIIAKSGSVRADLGGGPLEHSGDNTFQASEYCIKYELPPYNGEIYAKGNTWQDTYGNEFQPPAVLKGPADTDHFYIEDKGNKIIFSD